MNRAVKIPYGIHGIPHSKFTESHMQSLAGAFLTQ